ncbi:carbon-nitrogen hydrolase family protein [Nioella nitratireducens]|uniref:carbon-nitrogen hydrolase family protein n=1 Tax=Nioella nitratireducens TaxID=1287720 RepID=UPI0008FD8E33|nr:carbon-nitrogen hydrolase family protein [Nioella nitratireducens]
MRAALLQMCSSDRPEDNLDTVLAAINEAKAAGAEMLLTPEVTNCVSQSRTHQREVLRHQDDDPLLHAVRDAAAARGMWVLLGSLAIKTTDADGRFANRSFLISDQGDIAGWYDKIHMFDVQVSETETFRESAGYRPGDRAVVVETALARVGLTICYDMRFASLYRDLAQAGAQVLTVPAAFSPITGTAHWESLLRARAIETGCFVVAPAQTGNHAVSMGKPRQTHGHSLVVAPWGEVLLDAGTAPGLHVIDLNLKEVDKARGRVPSLRHDRPYTLVT